MSSHQTYVASPLSIRGGHAHEHSRVKLEIWLAHLEPAIWVLLTCNLDGSRPMTSCICSV